MHTNKQRQYHSNLAFVNTFYSYSNFTGLNSLICLKKANAVFVNTTIQNIQRVKVLAIIRATLNSSVNFLKSYIVKNSFLNPVVWVSNFSSILIEDCVVQNNLIYNGLTFFESKYYCHIKVIGSIFARNRISGATGKCFRLTYNITVQIFDTNFYRNQFIILVAKFNISAYFSHCQFVQNVFLKQSLAAVYHTCSIVIEKCSFINNSVKNFPTVGMVLNYRVSLNVWDSMFYNNSGIDVGMFSLSNTSAIISNVSFWYNYAISGSCFSLEKETEIQIRNSSFYSQGILSGVAVTSSSRSKLSFENCTFVQNSSPADSLIEIKNSTLKLTYCRINDNAMGIYGGFVQSKQSIVLVQD